MLQVTTAMKAQVMSAVRAVVTREKASEALYRQCHPNDILVERYKARRAAQRHEERRREEQRRRRGA